MSSYVGPEYVQSEVIQTLHGIPRFGRSNDISLLTSRDADAPMNYTIGALFVTFVVFALFVVCAAILSALQCMGPRLVGFWSGDGFVEPKDRGNKPYLRPRRVRITFLICALMVIAFTIAMVLFGLTSVHTTIITLQDSTMDVHDVVQEGSDIASSLAAIGRSTESIRNDVLIDLSTFCPNGDLTFIVEGSLNPDDISQALDDLNDFILGDLSRLSKQLESVRHGTEVVSRTLTLYTEWSYKPVYWVPLIVFSSIFLAGTILAWRQASPYFFRCIQSYIFLPLFTVWVIFSWILAGGIAAGAVMNADACSGGADPGSPGGTVKAILDENSFDPESLFYTATEYYVEGCRSDDPFKFIEDYRDELATAISMSNSFVAAVETYGTDDLILLCGNEDVSGTVEALKILHSNMAKLLEDADRTIALLSCKRINPIYVQTFHLGTCDHAIKGFTWMLGSLVVISVCGIVMIALRSALLHVRYRSSPARQLQGRASVLTKEVIPADVAHTNGARGDQWPNHNKQPLALPVPGAEGYARGSSKSFDEPSAPPLSPHVTENAANGGLAYETENIAPILLSSSSVEQQHDIASTDANDRSTGTFEDGGGSIQATLSKESSKSCDENGLEEGRMTMKESISGTSSAPAPIYDNATTGDNAEDSRTPSETTEEVQASVDSKTFWGKISPIPSPVNDSSALESLLSPSSGGRGGTGEIALLPSVSQDAAMIIKDTGAQRTSHDEKDGAVAMPSISQDLALIS